MLIAHPSLLDPNFRKTVLLLSSNDANEGSFGLIVNRPSGRSVGDLLPNKPLGALARLPVFLGGPVGVDQLVFAAFRWHPESERMECQHHLLIPDAQEAVEDENAVVRAFIGYAGWSKGQLEAELAQKSWLVGKPARDLLSAEKCLTLWRDTMGGLGPWFRLVADAPDDLTRN